MDRDDADGHGIARLLAEHHALRAALADLVAATAWTAAQGDGVDEWIWPQFVAACAALGIRRESLGDAEADEPRFRLVWPAHVAALVTVRGYRPIVEE